jgi:hypothetical protein
MAGATAIITVRLEPKLLTALKAKAREEGRSVSAEVVQLIRGAVEQKAPPEDRRRSMGMFADAGFEPVEIEDVRRLRRETAARLEERHHRRRRRA